MNSIFNSLLFSLTFISLLAGCSSVPLTENSACIPSNVTTGYDLALQRQDVYTVSPRKPMPHWWEPQLNKAQINRLILYKVNDIVTRSENEIWFADYPDTSENSIMRYNSDTGGIRKYAILGQNGKGFVAEELLAANDGTLWARLTMLGVEPNYSVLARYNSQKDGFDIVIDQDGLLRPVTTGGVHNISPGQSVLAQALDGSLSLVLDGEIYVYNPTTNQAKRILGHDQGFHVNSIATSKDGHVWFITGNDFSIRELDPTDGAIWNYGPPPGMTANDLADALTVMPKPLKVDDTGRVWVSDYGWLEPTNQDTRYEWHEISRSTVFISIYNPDYEYVWIRPDAVYQFSDGNMWYLSGIGVVQFNRQTGVWCWSATKSGPLAEDSNGTLWLVTNDQIYKYKYKLHP